ncbi:hypothetical protein OIU77_009570 [Salix suchowensis]|uniref:Uncharacterized protein n=1 Tax=Salix suchowensis TaxID=1278906 RepID=A0ABQ9AEW4_9ROSI|nr:hypothetical protein OIU77_009570 [Salix suchowensis]
MAQICSLIDLQKIPCLELTLDLFYYGEKMQALEVMLR